jgi:hypothetical protein
MVKNSEILMFNNLVCKVCKLIVAGYADKTISDKIKADKVTTIEVKRIRNKIRCKEISDKFF